MNELLAVKSRDGVWVAFDNPHQAFRWKRARYTPGSVTRHSIGK